MKHTINSFRIIYAHKSTTYKTGHFWIFKCRSLGDVSLICIIIFFLVKRVLNCFRRCLKKSNILLAGTCRNPRRTKIKTHPCTYMQIFIVGVHSCILMSACTVPWMLRVSNHTCIHTHTWLFLAYSFTINPVFYISLVRWFISLGIIWVVNCFESHSQSISQMRA